MSSAMRESATNPVPARNPSDHAGNDFESRADMKAAFA
jgi:hypothetical protein